VLYISMNSIIVLGPFTAYLLFGLQTENISRVGRNLSDLYDQKFLFKTASSSPARGLDIRETFLACLSQKWGTKRW
ncbi:MAG: hypothetical protein ACYDG7_07000, partial [Thermoleophilia bacterium]